MRWQLYSYSHKLAVLSRDDHFLSVNLQSHALTFRVKNLKSQKLMLMKAMCTGTVNIMAFCYPCKVPVEEMRQSVFWRIASVSSQRHLSVVDSVSQFGAELSDSGIISVFYLRVYAIHL